MWVLTCLNSEISKVSPFFVHFLVASPGLCLRLPAVPRHDGGPAGRHGGCAAERLGSAAELAGRAASRATALPRFGSTRGSEVK